MALTTETTPRGQIRIFPLPGLTRTDWPADFATCLFHHSDFSAPHFKDLLSWGGGRMGAADDTLSRKKGADSVAPSKLAETLKNFPNPQKTNRSQYNSYVGESKQFYPNYHHSVQYSLTNSLVLMSI